MLDVSAWVGLYGLWGLALAAFLAATLLPLSSEVAVIAALQLHFAPLDVLCWASFGNCLGALSNYVLGRCFTQSLAQRVQHERWGLQAWRWARRYGGWSLATSCLPLVGDPIMLVGGLLRFPLGYVVGLGLGTRVARYVLIIGVSHLWQA